MTAVAMNAVDVRSFIKFLASVRLVVFVGCQTSGPELLGKDCSIYRHKSLSPLSTAQDLRQLGTSGTLAFRIVAFLLYL